MRNRDFSDRMKEFIVSDIMNTNATFGDRAPIDNEIDSITNYNLPESNSNKIFVRRSWRMYRESSVRLHAPRIKMSTIVDNLYHGLKPVISRLTDLETGKYTNMNFLENDFILKDTLSNYLRIKCGFGDIKVATKSSCDVDEGASVFYFDSERLLNLKDIEGLYFNQYGPVFGDSNKTVTVMIILPYNYIKETINRSVSNEIKLASSKDLSDYLTKKSVVEKGLRNAVMLICNNIIGMMSVSAYKYMVQHRFYLSGFNAYKMLELKDKSLKKKDIPINHVISDIFGSKSVNLWNIIHRITPYDLMDIIDINFKEAERFCINSIDGFSIEQEVKSDILSEYNLISDGSYPYTSIDSKRMVGEFYLVLYITHSIMILSTSKTSYYTRINLMKIIDEANARLKNISYIKNNKDNLFSHIINIKRMIDKINKKLITYIIKD